MALTAVKTLSGLIDFEYIFNIEIGLIRFIREEFRDEKAFKLDVLDKSDREILSLLYSRKDYNPLSIISTEENMGDIKELYQSFLDNYKFECVKRSTIDKSIYKFVVAASMLDPANGAYISLGYNDKFELETLRRQFPNAKRLVSVKDLGEKIKDFDPYYVKDPLFFINNNCLNIIGKNIYVTKRSYNSDFFSYKKITFTRDNNVIASGPDHQIEKKKEGDKKDGR